MTEAELDRQLAALPVYLPSADIQARILAEAGVSPSRIAEMVHLAPPVVVDLAQRPTIARRVWPLALGAVALAAGLLLAISAPPERADPATLVPRGAGETVPTLGLRVAVNRNGAMERLAAGRAYHAGDTLVFRVTTSAPVEITVRRDDAVLFRGSVPAGDTDLPIGYALEAGEGPARFVVEGGGASDAILLPPVLP